MTRVTNNTKATLNFIVDVVDGQAKTDHVAAGETKSMKLDLDAADVRGHILSGAINIDERAAEKIAKATVAAKSAAAPAA